MRTSLLPTDHCRLSGGGWLADHDEFLIARKSVEDALPKIQRPRSQYAAKPVSKDVRRQVNFPRSALGSSVGQELQVQSRAFSR